MMNYGNGTMNGMMGGCYPNYQQKQIKCYNPLFDKISQDEINKLKGSSGLNLNVTDLEYGYATCNHHNSGDGTIHGIYEDDGSFTCGYCMENFRPINLGDATLIKAAVDSLLDILQTCKSVDPYPSDDLVKFYQMIPLIKKVPDVARYCYNKTNNLTVGGLGYYNNMNMGGGNAANMFNNIIAGPSPFMMYGQNGTNGFGYYGNNGNNMNMNGGMPFVNNGNNMNMNGGMPFVNNGNNMNGGMQQAQNNGSGMPFMNNGINGAGTQQNQQNNNGSGIVNQNKTTSPNGETVVTSVLTI